MNQEPINFRLTVAEFATSIQRGPEYVRRLIRCHHIKAEGRPYLIHPSELAKFQVDQPMARSRILSAAKLQVA